MRNGDSGIASILKFGGITMRMVKRLAGVLFVLSIALTAGVAAQGGNSIGGHVFGSQRTPLEGITVDLLDDFQRTLARVRTDSTGRFIFSRISAGKYRVRVLPFGTNYQEQEQEVEIVNIVRTDSRGNSMASGFDSSQRDFYLRPAKEPNPIINGTIFAQEVPEAAQRLYTEAVDLLKEKKSAEAYQKLKVAIESFPNYYMALETLGLEYVTARHFEAAEILLRKAVEVNPKSYKGWYGLAVALRSRDLDSDALKAAKAALQLYPGSVDAMLLTGTLLRQTGDYKGSESALTNAKKAAKDPNPEVFWQLALLYGNNLKRYKEAADELENFLKYMPKDKDPEKIKQLIKTLRDKSKKA
jgi:tetratricopeptide (TPR) repeat protein